ncbi:2-keto-4-pentenoate hydratase [Siminovitchia sediminis]|uniref:2-keto-4-pentenoate hydratase n=1 Tax=Siminovitchia sediminis TaxID=1274353 RepID=A0ABW4KHB5_9BACI
MTTKIADFAQELFHAEENRKEISPLTERDPSLTVEDAYQIQLETVKLKNEKGKTVIGKKVGLTSVAMQKMLNVDEPDYGHLFDDMKIESGSTIDTAEMIAPRVEAEIGFMLNEDLVGPHVTYLDVLLATEYVVPTLEIIDSRIADWKIKLIDTVADNGSSAKVVIGDRKTTPENTDLRTAGMALYKNDELMATGSGAAALGHPAEAIAWLANKLHEYGITLKKGELILPGALSAAMNVEAGNYVKADFGPLGSVSVTFK